MKVLKFGNSSAKACRVAEADFKSLLDEDDLSVEAQVFMALPKFIVDRARVF